MKFGKPEVVTFSFAHFKKQRVFFDPFIGKNSKCTIVQLYKRLFIGKCLLNFRNANLLFSKSKFYAGIKPIHSAAEMDMSRRLSSVKPKIFKSLKTINRHFHFLHCVNK